jgi:hypothetical protein
MRNPVEMGPLLKNLTEVQKIEELPEPTSVEQQPIEQPIKQPTQTLAKTQAQVTPQPTQGIPSGMTNIAPAGDIVQSPLDNQDATQPDELDTIKRNAGIVVESK